MDRVAGVGYTPEEKTSKVIKIQNAINRVADVGHTHKSYKIA